MKKIRIIALVLTTVLCCMSLTGCFGLVAGIQINPDGSGVVKMSMGMTEEYLKASDPETAATIDEMTKFTYNGVDYYGQVEETPFSSAEKFNSSLNLQNEDAFKLVKHDEGVFTLLFKVTPEDSKDIDTEISSSGFTPEEQEELEELMKNIAIVYELDFPSEVKQTRGPENGITIKGKRVDIDMLKVNEVVTEPITFEFTNADTKAFTDVEQKEWYYDAVTIMARGGLVAGVGNDMFNPVGTLTYAEFCQILARAKGLATGEENGYWASKAVKECIKAGYILDRGEVTPENYNVSIPREAAVSAMYLAKPASFKAGKEFKAEDIPDYASISPEYQENILKAYSYKITSGVDEKATFLPKNSLKRAEVCQLFYNLNWTVAGK